MKNSLLWVSDGSIKLKLKEKKIYLNKKNIMCSVKIIF
jgi:hypothetical protein